MLEKVHHKELNDKTHEIETIQNNFNTNLSEKKDEEITKTCNVNTEKMNEIINLKAKMEYFEKKKP